MVENFYKVFPQTCRRDDFWTQVKRTINGNPVDQEQIDMLVESIVSKLELQREDRILDICCGNGALTDILFERCAGGTGVDFSEFLIDVAKEYFERQPDRRYILDDALKFVKTAQDGEIFSKAVCSGALSYFTDENLLELFSDLRTNFPNIRRAYFGNIPDLSRYREFFSPEKYQKGMELDPNTAMGIWRYAEDLTTIGRKTGWHVEVSKMPAQYYAAKFRFDIVLTPAA